MGVDGRRPAKRLEQPVGHRGGLGDGRLNMADGTAGTWAVIQPESPPAAVTELHELRHREGRQATPVPHDSGYRCRGGSRIIVLGTDQSQRVVRQHGDGLGQPDLGDGRFAKGRFAYGRFAYGRFAYGRFANRPSLGENVHWAPMQAQTTTHAALGVQVRPAALQFDGVGGAGVGAQVAAGVLVPHVQAVPGLHGHRRAAELLQNGRDCLRT
jgi:hypothetical protein